MIDFDPNETFPNVDQGTLDALIEGLSLLKTDPTAAAVYLDRALRDFGEDGFCNGKLL